LNLPVPDQAFEIVDYWKKTPAALVAKGGRANPLTKGWLVLPERIFECELEFKYQRSIKFHLESRLGVKIRKNTPWEHLKAEMVLAELGR